MRQHFNVISEEAGERRAGENVRKRKRGKRKRKERRERRELEERRGRGTGSRIKRTSKATLMVSYGHHLRCIGTAPEPVAAPATFQREGKKKIEMQSIGTYP